MKPLTLEEIRLKEEMKHNCFWNNIYYKTFEAEKAFNLICHLEAFEVQYWKLQQENKQLKDNWNELRESLKDVMEISIGDDKGFVSTIIKIMQELESENKNE